MGLSRIDDYKRYFMQVANDVCPGFQVQPCQRDIVNDIFRWCMMLNGRLDVNKGLWLCGNIGTGKSTMLRIVKEFCKVVRPPLKPGYEYSFAIKNANEICSGFIKKGYDGIEESVDSPRLAIDELGREPLETGHYRNSLNVIGYILQCRYDKRFTNITHVTTNCTDEDIKSRYGLHIYDRTKEMFNIVKFTGSTFRR